MRVFIIGQKIINDNNSNEFCDFCQELGKGFANKNIDLIVCSPFPNSADAEIVKGIKNNATNYISLEIHYPDAEDIEEHWHDLLEDLDEKMKIVKIRHQAPYVKDWKTPSKDEIQTIKYAWLYSQIQAINNSDFVVVIGGKLEGASNLLVRIAEAQGKRIIPLSKFGGVGKYFFERTKYQLSDFWGHSNCNEFKAGNNPLKIVDIIAENPKDEKFENIKQGNNKPTFFISYSKKKPSDADYIEMLLRRRNLDVIRDETFIQSSEDIPNAIKENICKSDVFIALWCQEYACSPWCFDEFSIALESHQKPDKALWIIRTDKTRMVHPKARKLLWYDADNREAIEGKILSLLSGLNPF